MNWSNLLSTKTQVTKEKEPSVWSGYPISEFEKDYQITISGAAFRRLQDKTQVFPLDKSDFVRTRLTHSIEVSTIAKQLGIMIAQNETVYLPEDFKNDNSHNQIVVQNIPTVLSCAGLLHDIGNPPFGHFGETVIQDWFKHELKKFSFAYKNRPIDEILTSQMKNDLCHFDGNAQALRILSKIRYNPRSYDVNLTYSVINTLIKYPTDSEHINNSDSADIKLHKAGFFLAETPLFLEVCKETGTMISENEFVRHPLTYLLEAADDIAYRTSDLEDAFKKKLFTIEQFISFYKTKLNEFPLDEKTEKSKELIQYLEEQLNMQPERTSENDLVTFQKWTVYVKKWLMYVVAYSFSYNYGSIMNGSYMHDMFYTGFHSYTMQILKAAMQEFVFNSREILKLELSAQKIISSLLTDFIYAVILWDAEDENYRLTQAQRKYINIISENYKNDYLRSRGEDEAENLYLRFLMVTDYISGMTDSFAKNLYQELNGVC